MLDSRLMFSDPRKRFVWWSLSITILRYTWMTALLYVLGSTDERGSLWWVVRERCYSTDIRLPFVWFILIPLAIYSCCIQTNYKKILNLTLNVT